MARILEETEGDNLIQHFEISSTSDIYYFPLRPSKTYPSCRSSYRRRFLRFNNHPSITSPNSRIMQNPSVTITPLSKIDMTVFY